MAIDIEPKEDVIESEFGLAGVLASHATTGVVAPVTMAPSTILARLAAGEIKAATVSELQALLAVPVGLVSGTAIQIDIADPGLDTATIVLNGTTAKNFCPSRLVLTLTNNTGGALTGDAHITLGTVGAGVDILPSTELTGLVNVGNTFSIDLNDLFPTIPGDSTLHLSVVTADTAGVAAKAYIAARIEGTEA